MSDNVTIEELRATLYEQKVVAAEVAAKVDAAFQGIPNGARMIVTLALVEQLLEQTPKELRLGLANAIATSVMRYML